METQNGTLHTIARHLVIALQPLKAAVTDLPAFRTLLYRLGWDVKSLPPEYTALAATVDRSLAALESLGDDPAPEAIFNVLREVKALYIGLRSITNAPEGVDAAEFLPEIGRSLFELLLADYLNDAFPSVHAALLALDILSQRYVEETDSRPGVLLTHFQWEEVPRVLSDPGSIATRVYGWGTDDLDFHRLAGHLLELFVAANWPAYIGRVDRELGRGFKDTPDDASSAIDWELRIPALMDNIGGEEIEVGIALLELPAQGGKPAGLILQPLVPAAIGTSFDLADRLKFELRAGSDVGKTFGVLLRPGDISVKFPFQEGAALPAAGFGVALRYAPENPTLLLGAPGRSRLELKGATTSLSLDARAGQLELRVELVAENLKLLIAAADVDGFLGELLGGQDVTVPLPLAVRWSSETGIGFAGGTGFEVRFPGRLRIGPVTLQQIQLALRSTLAPGHAPDLILEAGGALGGQIGPVAVAVDNVGLRLVSRFDEGNAGPFDIELGFKPPTGIGLSIEAPTVTGGGFLGFDPQKQEYSGMLELVVAETIAVKATGLLVTRLPSGLKGYALLVLITAEGFKPVPLPLGFRLTGIGGLLAVNRTFDEAALRAGLKSGTLESVMFPRDPIRNASQILGNLDRLFPPASGHHLFGPMARIEWGTPTLFTADLALVLEFGARLRLLLLARVQAVLPKPEHDLVRLQMNGLGVVDFDQGTAALDATLYDSRLLKKFVLTGDMAMRLKWETSPHFALAVGGLHPAFNPPPGFPALERIALNLTAGDNPRFRCEAYFALTANTVQFGARAELYAAAHGFSLQGETGFDVLIQLDPFQFLADFHAQVQLKRGSTNLFKVRVEGALAGPRPLHLKAKATFEVLWWDVSIRVDKTLIEGEKPPPPAPVEVLPRLKEALSDPANWMGRLPEGERPMVTLRPRVSSAVLLHPLGTLSVKQGVVPLDLEISRFGPAAPAGARRFSISRVSRGGQPQTPEPVKDFFAPAQFFEMSDEAKLSRPSFEPMTAGLAIGSQAIVFSADPGDWLEVPAIEFETLIVDKATGETRSSRPQGPPGEPVRYRLDAALLGRQARFGAAGASGLRRSGRARYRGAVGKYRVEKVGWQVVAAKDLAVPPLPGLEAGRPATYSEAAQALAAFRRQDPARAAGLKILRASELL